MYPILFEYGPIQIRFYGLMYVVAILVGSYLLKSEVKRKGIDLTEDDVMNVVLWTVLGGVLGARLYYVAFNLDYYLAYPKEIPAVWHGGLAIHGGLLGGAFVAWRFLKKRGINYWLMANLAAPAIVLGQAFGRIGNFMNGDAHGAPTDMPWGVVFPKSSIAGNEFPGIPIHPTMIYEGLINFSIFILLWFGLRKKDFGNGFLFALYVILYSVGRFFVEAFRADSLMLGPLRAAQVASLGMIAVAATIIIAKKLWRPAVTDDELQASQKKKGTSGDAQKEDATIPALSDNRLKGNGRKKSSAGNRGGTRRRRRSGGAKGKGTARKGSA